MLDLCNPHHRREAMIRYFGAYGIRLSSAEITLATADYREIPPHIAAAENAKVSK